MLRVGHNGDFCYSYFRHLVPDRIAILNRPPGKVRMSIDERRKRDVEQGNWIYRASCAHFELEPSRRRGRYGHMAPLKLEVIQDIAPIHAPTSHPHQPQSPAREPEHMFASTAMQAQSTIMQAPLRSHLSYVVLSADSRCGPRAVLPPVRDESK
jgi:hypothetical protein